MPNKMIKLDGDSKKFSNTFSSKKNMLSTCKQSGKVHFLNPLNQVPKETNQVNKVNLENTSNTYITDLKAMSATELRNKYPLEYNSWKNMKSRCKKGYVLSPEFAQFKSFLRCMGPCGGKGFTLDRIDYKNLNYSPDNCRWADKFTQNQNKGNTVYLTYNGETYPVSVWAKKTNQNADTLYHRRKLGWTDAEIITGKKLGAGLKNSVWPEGHEEYWEEQYNASGMKKCKWRFLLKRLAQMRDLLNADCELRFEPNSELPEEITKKYQTIEYHIQRGRVALSKIHKIKVEDVERLLRPYD